MSPSDHNFQEVEKVSTTPGDPLHYLGPPSEDQLFGMLPLMNAHESSKVLRFRYRVVGPLPHYILDVNKFKERNAGVGKAMKAIQNVEILHAFIETGGWVLHGSTLPGMLLAVAGAHRVVFHGQKISRDYEDYDGLHIDYENQVVLPLNRAIKRAIEVTYRSHGPFYVRI
jgi:hypothetical protein